MDYCESVVDVTKVTYSSAGAACAATAEEPRAAEILACRLLLASLSHRQVLTAAVTCICSLLELSPRAFALSVFLFPLSLSLSRIRAPAKAVARLSRNFDLLPTGHPGTQLVSLSPPHLRYSRHHSTVNTHLDSIKATCKLSSTVQFTFTSHSQLR